MGKTIKQKNEALLRKLIRKAGISEEKFVDIWNECVSKLGVYKWSKEQINSILSGYKMGDLIEGLFSFKGLSL